MITLTVEALDVHSNRLNAIAQKAVTDVQVLIMDINDNYPQFTEQSYQLVNFHITLHTHIPIYNCIISYNQSSNLQIAITGKVPHKKE